MKMWNLGDKYYQDLKSHMAMAGVSLIGLMGLVKTKPLHRGKNIFIGTGKATGGA